MIKKDSQFSSSCLRRSGVQWGETEGSVLNAAIPKSKGCLAAAAAWGKSVQPCPETSPPGPAAWAFCTSPPLLAVCTARVFPQFPGRGESQHVNLVDFSLSEIAGHDCFAAPHSREIRETVCCVVLLSPDESNTMVLLTRRSSARSLF